MNDCICKEWEVINNILNMGATWEIFESVKTFEGSFIKLIIYLDCSIVFNLDFLNISEFSCDYIRKKLETSKWAAFQNSKNK